MLRTLLDNGLAPSLKPLDKEFLELDVLNALYELKQKEIRINRDIIKASKIVDKNSHIRESIRLFTEYKEIENTNAYEKFLETIESIKNAYKLVSMDFGMQKDKSKKKHGRNNAAAHSSDGYKFSDLLMASLDNKHGATKTNRSDGKPPFVEDETMFRIEHELTKILDDTEKSDQKQCHGVTKNDDDDDSKKEAENSNATEKSGTESDSKTTTKLNVESAAFVPNNRWVPSCKLNQQPWYENKLLMTAIKDSYKSNNPLGELPSIYERWTMKSNPHLKSWECLLIAADNAKKGSGNMTTKRNYAEPDQSEYRSRASSWTASQKKAYDNQRPGSSRNNKYGKQKSRNSFNGYDKNRGNYQQKSNRPEIDTRVYKNSDKNNLEPTVKSFFSRNSNFNYKSLTTVSTEIVQEKETFSIKTNNANRRNTSNPGKKVTTKSFAKFLRKMKDLNMQDKKKSDETPLPVNKYNENSKMKWTRGESVSKYNKIKPEPKPGTSKDVDCEASSSSIIFIPGRSSPSPNMEILSKRFNVEQLKEYNEKNVALVKDNVVPLDKNKSGENENVSPSRRKSFKSRRRKRTPKKNKSAGKSSETDSKANISFGSPISLCEPTFGYQPPSSSKEQYPRNQLCLFCRCYVKNFIPEKAQHRVYDEFGKVTCPVLFKTVCRFCGATGQDAHITNFCPHNQKLD